MMVSVCMASYNGEKYIKEQIDSILPQLASGDELIISDDHSTDRTAEIVASYQDDRIKFVLNEMPRGVTHNFENALMKSKGDIIFFADQDDVWLPTKIKEMTDYLKKTDYEIITCSAALTDANLNITDPDWYKDEDPIKRGFVKNFVVDKWLGACMAFRREVMPRFTPFPPKAAAHDYWIGLFANLHLKCGYYPKVLQLFRRHENVVSHAGSKSTNSLSYKISYRLYVAWYLLKTLLK